jgi:hypothetical protein
MFGTPSANKKEMSVVTPYLPETLSVVLPETQSVIGDPLLKMRYLRLNEVEQDRVSEIFSRRQSIDDVIIDRFSIQITNRLFETLNSDAWIIGEVSKTLSNCYYGRTSILSDRIYLTVFI